MSILKVLQEAKLPPFDKIPSLDSLPPAIKEKVCFIAKLIDQATLFLHGKQTFPENIYVDSSLNGSSAREDSQDETEKILHKLFNPLYPKENDDFGTHLKKSKARPELMLQILKIIYEVCPECGQRIFNKINEGLLQSSNNDLINRTCENIELMGKPEYEPSPELTEIKVMLQELLCYWLTLPFSQITIRNLMTYDSPKTVEKTLAGLEGQGPETINERWKVLKDESAGLQDPGLDIEAVKAMEAALDLSLAKLAHQVGKKTALIHQWGRREGNRTASVNRTKRNKKATNAQLIAKTFYGLKFPKEEYPKGASLNKVAKRIFFILKEAYSIDTIKRALRNDEDIWKKFVPKGRNHFIEQM